MKARYKSVSILYLIVPFSNRGQGLKNFGQKLKFYGSFFGTLDLTSLLLQLQLGHSMTEYLGYRLTNQRFINVGNSIILGVALYLKSIGYEGQLIQTLPLIFVTLYMFAFGAGNNELPSTPDDCQSFGMKRTVV